MPNWCTNHLSVYGKDDDMKAFLNAIKSDDSYALLENLYPTPDELNIGDVPFHANETMKALKEKYGYASWYDWRIDNWGCKWPENDLFVSSPYEIVGDEHGLISFQFETPWSPPVDAFNKICQDYPTLLFCLYYEEEGMGFCGKNIWCNGELQEEHESEIVRSYFDEEYLYNQYTNNK